MRGTHIFRLTAAVFAAAALISAVAEDFGLRPAPIVETAPTPPISPHEDDDERRTRNYPEQPPTIPHAIDGYEIHLRANKCLACHSRRRSVQTGAPMVSVSHFMGRDFQVLGDVSPRRYFCLQCHVPQTAVDLLVPNNFIDGADLPDE